MLQQACCGALQVSLLQRAKGMLCDNISSMLGRSLLRSLRRAVGSGHACAACILCQGCAALRTSQLTSFSAAVLQVLFSSSVMYGNFLTIAQRRALAKEAAEHANRCGSVLPPEVLFVGAADTGLVAPFSWRPGLAAAWWMVPALIAFCIKAANKGHVLQAEADRGPEGQHEGQRGVLVGGVA